GRKRHCHGEQFHDGRRPQRQWPEAGQWRVFGYHHRLANARKLKQIMPFNRFLMATCLAFTAVMPVSPALATTVSPVMVDLQTNGRGVVANISVNNTGAGALPIEIQVIPLTPTATGLQPGKGDTDEDLPVTPPSVLIPAGKTQTFRVQWIGDPELNSSKHYYISINQLPVKLPE